MTGFTIHTKSQGTFDANFAINDISEINNLTKGDTATFAFDLNVADPLYVASGDTYTISSGNTETHDIVTVDGTLIIDGTLNCNYLDDNGTVDLNGTLNISGSGGLSALQNYDEYAGQYSLIETTESEQAYRETLPTDAPIDSLVLGIEPSQELQDENVKGIWGIVSNVTDIRDNSLNTRRLQFQTQILAWYSDYADHTSLESALKV